MGLYINKKSQIMRRLWKLLWMIFIFCVVFFIICDEKWIKIELQDWKLVFNEIEKPKEVIIDPNAVYKNSNLVHINYEFENPKTLRKSDWVDRKYIAKLEKALADSNLEKKKRT